METSPVGIVTVDKTGNISYANIRAEQVLGLVKEEITSRSYDAPLWKHTALDGSPFPDEKQPFNIVKKSLNTVFDIQHGITWPDGSVKILSVNAAPIKDSAGQFDGMIASIEDITEIKRAEEVLRKSEEKFKNLFEGNIAPMFLIEADNGNVADVNEAAVGYYGWSRDEMCRMNINQINTLPPEEIRKEMANARKFKRVYYEFKHRKADGSVRDVEVFGSKIEIDGKEHLHLIIHDITEKKKAEQVISEQKELLTAIYRNAPLIMMVVNSERRIQQINGYVTQLAGTDAEDMLGLRSGEALRCVHALDDPKGCGFGEFCQQCVIRNSILDTLETGKTHLQEEAPYFFNEEDDKIREMTFMTSTTAIMVHGERMVLVTLQDITDRKKAEKMLQKNNEIIQEKNEEYESLNEELRQTNEELIEAKETAEENQEKFRLLFNKVEDAIFRYDPETYEIIEANEATSKIYGYKQEELIGMSALQFSAEAEKSKSESNKALQTGKVIVNLRHHKTKDGRDLFLQLQVHKIVVNNQSITYAVSHDITENVKYQQELKAAKEKAEENDRLKTAFLNNMSHEIRTPLNAICGFTEILNNTEITGEKRERLVSIIQNSSNQLLSIVTDILTISALETKQEKVYIEKVSVNTIIDDLLLIFKQQASDRNISLHAKKDLSDKASVIYTDNTKITQILSNLLSNALKFTHDGFIDFGYELIDLPASASSGSVLQFYVKDSGIGIKPEVQEKIFDRFIQADKSISSLYGGTGLGLSISKAFAELLGGKIWVKSQPEKGSAFYFTIPYKPAEKPDKTPPPPKINNASGVLLVAEDEENNYLLIEAYLSDLDLDLIHAKDGQEALDICQSNSNIDIILMDIKMPIMTGDEAARRIKEINPNLPIIAQSGYALEHEIKRYKELFDDYLAKPIKQNDLTECVMKFIKTGK